ncbi:ribosome-associated heat shock protein Hsp15 [compost metagenome]
MAQEVADQGRVYLNGREAKKSSEVKVGDELTIRFGQKSVTVRVESIAETSRKDEAAGMYTVLREESHKE